MELETRTCVLCNKEKYVVLDFTAKNSRKICKQCVSQKTKESRRKYYPTDPNQHWRYQGHKLYAKKETGL